MNLSKQIHTERMKLKLSQEELALKLFVSRQTISNWETGKNYPDLQSLILLSEVFNVTLDILVKGDIEEMKQIINQEEVKKVQQLSIIYTTQILCLAISVVPLFLYLGREGVVIWILELIPTFIVALKIENNKKKNNIQTYKEIVAFTEGRVLSDIEKIEERGKQKYQKVIIVVMVGVISALIAIVMSWILMLF